MAQQPTVGSLETDIDQYVLSSTIPTLITIDPQDVAAAVVPPPLFLMLPRSSLLVGAWMPLEKHLRPYVASLKDDELPLWLELRNTEQCVPWHYPVGALADVMFGADVPLHRLVSSSNMDDDCDVHNADTKKTSSSSPRGPGSAVQSWCSAPLALTAHVGEPRRDKRSKVYAWRVRCEKDCQTVVQQSVKASLATMYDDTKSFFKLSAKPTMAVVQAALAYSEKDVQQAHRDVLAAWTEMDKASGVDDIIAWPCFAHVMEVFPSSEACVLAAVQRGESADTLRPVFGALRVVPMAIKKTRDQGDLTFGSLLRDCLPTELLQNDGESSLLPSEGQLNHPKIRVIVNGTEPLMETPVEWLIENFKAADGALHFAVILIKANDVK